MESLEPLEDLTMATRGETEVDLLIEGAELVNTLSGEVQRADVAIHRGRTIGFDCSCARKSLNLSGSVLSPDFIDAHVPLESAMVTVTEYARDVVPEWITTSGGGSSRDCRCSGMKGVRYILESSKDVPLNVYVMLSSCVPATHLETSRAELDVKALQELIDHERILGLAEVMNYPGVIYRNPAVLEKISMARPKNIDGRPTRHSDRGLQAYIAARIRSDHECSSLEDAKEKLRLGMSIIIREGRAAENLQDLLSLVTPLSSRQFMFVSDDRHHSDILDEGHINFMIGVAIQSGMDPTLALQIASFNAARYFCLKDLGAIAPGFRADITVLDDLENLSVKKVFKDGRLVAEDGHILVPLPSPIISKGSAMRVRDLSLEKSEIPSAHELDFIRVTVAIPDQIVTKSLLLPAKISEGKAIADISRDILVMAVIERHRTTGNVGLGFVQGFGLKGGTLATSVDHDPHNIAVVGISSKGYALRRPGSYLHGRRAG
jgi:adenine deaminase